MISQSPFILHWLPRVAAQLPRGAAALDLASGMGRHTMALAEAGLVTFAVDRAVDDVAEVRQEGARRGIVVHAWAADLEQTPLPPNRFDLILCTRYLQRSLWPSLRGAVRPRGFVLYETFTTEQRRHDAGPRSPDHLLLPGELRQAFAGWEILCDEEIDGNEEAVAHIVARK